MVRLLFKRNDIDFNLRDENGRTPLSLTAGKDYDAVVQLLLQREDINADSWDTGGFTPLSRAVKSGMKWWLGCCLSGMISK